MITIILTIYLISIPISFLVCYLIMHQMRKLLEHDSVTYGDLIFCLILSLSGTFGVISGLIVLAIDNADKPVFKNKTKIK